MSFPLFHTFRVRPDGPQLGAKQSPVRDSTPRAPSRPPIFVLLRLGELPDALLPWELAALAGCGPDNPDGQGEVFDKWVKRLKGATYHGLLSAGADDRIDRGTLKLYLDSLNEKAEGGLALWLGNDTAGLIGEVVKTGEAKARLIREGLARWLYLLEVSTKKGNEDIKACRPPNGKNWDWPKLLAAMKKRDEAASYKSSKAPATPPANVHKYGYVKGGR